jgi:hypothetical protein
MTSTPKDLQILLIISTGNADKGILQVAKRRRVSKD